MGQDQGFPGDGYDWQRKQDRARELHIAEARFHQSQGEVERLRQAIIDLSKDAARRSTIHDLNDVIARCYEIVGLTQYMNTGI